jgi:hypothetical protein
MRDVISDSGVDHSRTAQKATELFNDQALQRALASRAHTYTIVWSEGGRNFMTSWTGTASERVEHMSRGLKIDLDHGQWATGYWDDKSQRWATCGTSVQLRQYIETMPVPVSR